MEGVWTFVVPQTQAGGVITAKNGKLYGGDSGYFLSGTYTINGESAEGHIDAVLFNPDGIKESVWGDKAQRFQMQFQGNVADRNITGLIKRVGIAQHLKVRLIRRADVP